VELWNRSTALKAGLQVTACAVTLGRISGRVVVAAAARVRPGQLFPPDGGWSIHNTEVLGDRAYSSWYSHGIVALDVRHPTRPAKVGQFVPPPPAGGEPPFALVWGVATDRETGIVYASDINSGLWIVRPTGRARPGT
jgi:hypothetical protein